MGEAPADPSVQIISEEIIEYGFTVADDPRSPTGIIMHAVLEIRDEEDVPHIVARLVADALQGSRDRILLLRRTLWDHGDDTVIQTTHDVIFSTPESQKWWDDTGRRNIGY